MRSAHFACQSFHVFLLGSLFEGLLLGKERTGQKVAVKKNVDMTPIFVSLQTEVTSLGEDDLLNDLLKEVEVCKKKQIHKSFTKPQWEL